MITGLLSTLLEILKWAFVAYFFISLFFPQSKLYQVLRAYADLLLNPFRAILRTLIPSSANWRLDFSPLLLFLVLQVLIWLLTLLGKLI